MKKRHIGFARWKKSDAQPLGLRAQRSRSLGDKVESMKNKRDEIIAALDLLFTGI